MDQVSSKHKVRLLLARILRVMGIACLATYFLFRMYCSLWNYAAVEAITVQNTTSNPSDVDFSLWDSKRIKAYKDSLIKKIDPPLAVLKVNRIGLVVSVYEGTDDLTLDRGAGHIPDTTPIGNNRGNIGIAGHRDGFFRGLKNVSIGDVIQLVTTESTSTYKISEILIVKPEDLWVLEPKQQPTLTLVTCYPFYFFGHAPERYIVKAVLKTTEPKTSSKK
ncbi:class D sortase [bacterium]|nr:class D sortase [bacterium]